MLGCFLSFKMNEILSYGHLGHIKGCKKQVELKINHCYVHDAPCKRMNNVVLKSITL